MNILGEWLQPDYRFASVYEIDYGLLYERGIRVLFFDLDQTLVLPSEFWEPSLKLKMLFQKLRDQQFQCFIITNRRSSNLLRNLSQRLDCPIVCSCFKPAPWLLKNLIEQNFPGKTGQIAVIGDHLFTDILLAKGLHCRSVWVHSLKPVHDWYRFFLGPLEELQEKKPVPQGHAS